MLTCEVPIFFNKNVQLWKSYSIFLCKFCALFLLCVHLWLCSTSNQQYVTPSSRILITELFFLNDLIGEKIMQESITSRPYRFKTKRHTITEFWNVYFYCKLPSKSFCVPCFPMTFFVPHEICTDVMQLLVSKALTQY